MDMSLYIGILFSGGKSVLSGAVFSIGAIFFLVFVLVIPMQTAVIPLVEDRAVLYRETVSGTYGRLSYRIGQLFADQPFHLLNTFLMWIFFYFLVDFRRTGGEMGYFLLMLYLTNWVNHSQSWAAIRSRDPQRGERQWSRRLISYLISDFDGILDYCQCNAIRVAMGVLGQFVSLYPTGSCYK
ncbi:ABC-2 type transporter [Nitzschia inconspicua]|uniref:ABC-2 type transporter n=1 Tax=Nitzschia inconspicua TaxID=303405 RepID=A0A9K3KXQ0_9STRA|nr:ABC-2 type transporter [Nitzschia inconspicua]